MFNNVFKMVSLSLILKHSDTIYRVYKKRKSRRLLLLHLDTPLVCNVRRIITSFGVRAYFWFLHNPVQAHQK